MKIVYYIYVFDYSNCSIYEIPVSETMDKQFLMEDIVKQHNFHMSEVSYMGSNRKLNIIELL